jgi:hypothetical protein
MTGSVRHQAEPGTVPCVLYHGLIGLLAMLREDLSGNPWACIAVTNAEHTARPVARSTTVAMMQNREWSPNGSR